jgi:hypothetical protein
MRTEPDEATGATGEPDDIAIVAAESDAPADSLASRRTRTLYYVTGIAAAASIVSAAILAIAHHWVPVSDPAFFAVRAQDVFSAHPPLLGTWTSASASAGVNLNNPGPLYFDALAIPTAIFGSTNAGVGVGVALVNLLCAIGIGVVARRQGGYVVGAAAFTIVAVFAWTLGSEVLLEPVQPGALLLPLLLACMLVWGVARDDLALFPWLVGVASLLLQTYVTYVFLVAFIAVWAVLCIVLRLHASHYDREQVRRVRTTGLVALAVGLVCWIQPIYQQFFGDGPGNFTQLWRAVRSPTKTYGPNTGTRLMADVVSLPPFWFRPSFHDFLAVRNVPKSSLPVAIVTLLVVAALLAGLARLAIRSTRDVVGTAAATGLVVFLAGVVTAIRIPIGLFGLPSSHVYRWLWALGAFFTFVFLIALVRYARTLAKPVTVTAVLTIIALLFAGLNLQTTDQNPDTITDYMPVARDIGKQLSVLKGKGPLVVDVRFLRFPAPYSTYVFAALQHYGIDFKVNEQIAEYQLGHFRHFDGSNARGAVFLRDGDDVDLAPPNSERVAVHYGLNPADRAEMTKLQGEIAALMNDGTITLNDGGKFAVAVRLAQPPPTDPAKMANYIQGDDFAVLVKDKALEAPPDAQAKIDRYTELHTDWQRHTVAVYLGPLSAIAPLG